jgi:hypothetical protein
LLIEETSYLFPAAFLVFLPASAWAGIVSADFGWSVFLYWLNRLLYLLALRFDSIPKTGAFPICGHYLPIDKHAAPMGLWSIDSLRATTNIPRLRR